MNVISAAALRDAIAGAGFKIYTLESHGTKRKDARPVIIAREPD